MQEKEPWILDKKLQSIKSQDSANSANEGLELQAQIDNCLHICLQLCANLAIFINPFLPHAAKKMVHMMKVVDKMLDWENGGKTKLLSVGYSLREPSLLFRKIEDSEVFYQVEKLRKGMENSKTDNVQLSGGVKVDTAVPKSDLANVNALKPEIVYDDFGKLDLRIGTILHAEKVEKADKLLKLEIDLGFEKRTIVSGIAQHFNPESLLNKQVIVIANLASRKMRGIESQGMILTAEEADGRLVLVNPENLTQNGSGVK